MPSIVRSHRPAPLDRQLPPSAQSGLPGAWLSTWSLSEMTPVNAEFCGDVRDELALRKTMTGNNLEGTVSFGSGTAETGYRSPRVSIVHSDGESTCSADYYSMGSDVDMDDTITPGGSPTNEAQEVGLVGLKAVVVSDTSSMLPHELDGGSSLRSSGSFEVLSFSTHRTTPEEYASSDGEGSGSKPTVDFQQSASGSSKPGSPSACSRPSRVTRVFLRPPSQIDLTNPRTSVASTSTNQTDDSGIISSSASAAYGDDESDHHSDNSEDGENDDEFEFQREHDDFRRRVSNPSHVAVSVLPGQSHNLRKPSLGHTAPATPAPRRMESELDFHSLGQPDGSDPWTLGLDPTLASMTGPDSTSAASSRSSTLSFSVTAESEDHDSAVDQELEHTQPSSMGSQSQASLEDPSPGATLPADEDETVQFRQTLEYPSTLILDARPSTSSVGGPPSTVIQKKSVAQKTKKFYQKVKRFFTPKPTRPISSQGIANDPYRPTNNVDFPVIPDTPSTAGELPPTSTSPHQWTVYRRSLFGRSRKVSNTHSLAQSFTPGDFTTQPRYFPRSASVVPDERYTYEYHARPKTLEEIKMDTKRGRRISLPVGLFSGPPSPRLAPSVHGSAVGVGRSNLGALPSISSSLHVPQQRWPSHPPTFTSRSSSRME